MGWRRRGAGSPNYSGGGREDVPTVELTVKVDDELTVARFVPPRTHLTKVEGH